MITVVGMDGSPLSAQAEAALASATLVVGGRRHLAALPAIALAAATTTATATAGEPGATSAPGGAGDLGEPPAGGPRTMVLGELVPALDALAAHDGDAVVLASGDPGFFGIVRALRARGLSAMVLPAVSSVALAFARAGLPWDDAAVVSAHGRDLRPAVNVCRAHPKVAVLTGPGAGPAEIGAALAVGPSARRLRAPRLRCRTGHRVLPRLRRRPHLDRPQRGPRPRPPRARRRTPCLLPGHPAPPPRRGK